MTRACISGCLLIICTLQGGAGVWKKERGGGQREKSATEPQLVMGVMTSGPLMRVYVPFFCSELSMKFHFSGAPSPLSFSDALFFLLSSPEGRWVGWLCCDTVPFQRVHSSLSSFQEKDQGLTL